MTAPGRAAAPRPSPCRDDAQGFWPGFAAGHYRQRPYETDEFPPGLAASAGELFPLLLRACALRGNGPKDPQVRFYIAQREVLQDLDDWLPVTADGSLDGYLARMDAELSGAPYLLTVQRLHAVSRTLWKRAAAFLAGLCEATGSLPGDAEVEAFVGRYPHTPTGIHQERSGVFVAAVHGAKDVLAWPPPTGGLPLRSGRYGQERAGATRLRCEPGRLVYWPAMYWHVAESPAASAAVHLAVLEEPPGPRGLLATAAGSLPAASGHGIDLPPRGAGETPLPSQYEVAARALAGALGDAGAVRDRLTADWLRRRTGCGFCAPPPRRGATVITADQLVVRDSVLPIVLARRDAATSWCAADGRVARVRSSPALTAAIDKLNAGEQFAVDSLLGLGATSAERRLLLATLALLADWQALAVSDPGGRPAAG
ncbi:MAG TPA: hypothetical protein VEL03_07675 [Streptosporangiaceae bacterium]|nr:hypothetical protein [Streptosporangiaceae bacterium]